MRHTGTILPTLVICSLLAGSRGIVRAEWTFFARTGQWVHTEAKDLDTEVSDAQFQHGLEAFQRGEAADAERVIEGWLRYYRGQRDCQWALFLLGEIRRTLGHYDSACAAFEELLDRYAGTELFDRALTSEIEMAQEYLNGRRRTVLKVLRVSAEDEGQTILERVFQRDPRGVHGRKALTILADYHFRTGRFDQAEDEYQRLATNFAHDPDAAKFKLQAAQAALGRFRGTSRDARPLSEARQQFEQLRQEHPGQAEREQVAQIVRGIDERRAEKDFQTGEFYRKVGQTKPAVFYYRVVIRDYPGTVWAAQARERLAGLGVRDVAEPNTAPRVTGAGVGIKEAGGAETPVPPLDVPPDNSGTVIDPQAVGAGQVERPVRILWAAPAPTGRPGDQATIIDLDAPPADAPARQLGDVVGPVRRPPASQPERRHDG